MTHRIFLDLEETLVTSWHDPVICKKQKVDAFLDWYRAVDDQILDVELFSFAVYDDRDKKTFADTMQKWLEDVFKVRFVAVHSCDDIAKEISRLMMVEWDRHEIITVLGKHRSFIEFCIACADDNAVLLDDVVPNMRIIYDDPARIISLWNVDKMEVR